MEKPIWLLEARLRSPEAAARDLRGGRGCWRSQGHHCAPRPPLAGCSIIHSGNAGKKDLVPARPAGKKSICYLFLKYIDLGFFFFFPSLTPFKKQRPILNYALLMTFLLYAVAISRSGQEQGGVSWAGVGVSVLVSSKRFAFVC